MSYRQIAGSSETRSSHSIMTEDENSHEESGRSGSFILTFNKVVAILFVLGIHLLIFLKIIVLN